MSDDDETDDNEPRESFEEHVKRREHAPWCPAFKGGDKGSTKVSSGAVSPKYRANYDAIFGKIPVGEA